MDPQPTVVKAGAGRVQSKAGVCISRRNWKKWPAWRRCCTVCGLITLFFFVVLVIFALWFLQGVGPCSEIGPYLTSDEYVSVSRGPENWLVFTPATPHSSNTAFVFLPGAKVAAESYAPVAKGVAKLGFLVVVPSFPLRFAIIDSNVPARIYAHYQNDYANWAIGGHSLGAATSGLFLARSDRPAAFTKLALLSGTPASSVRDQNLHTTVVYGTHDGFFQNDVAGWVSNAQSLLPTSNTVFVPIQGGIHAYMGCYGLPGTLEGFPVNDGVPTINRENQTAIVVEAIGDLLMI